MNQTGLYVQFGCGLSAPEGWLNFDASPTLRVHRIPLLGRIATRSPDFPSFPDNVRYGDIVRGLPLEPSSCAAIYCSHVLEHLSLEDFRVALRNSFEYLQPGGTFRIVVPDLELLARRYLDSPGADAALDFMENAHLGEKTRNRGLAGAARSWLGNSKHLWMWDYKSLSRELKTAGFTNIRRAELGDSGDRKFADVEDPSRWQDALGVSCEKPAIK